MRTTSMLPDAILQERQAMLGKALQYLQEQGCAELSAHDASGYQEPRELLIPVLNVHAQPDIMGCAGQNKAPALAVVEVSTDLGEESCGRRWQVLSGWAHDHEGTFTIFVHPEDRDRASAIAQHWHLDDQCVVPLNRN
ncbi:MAG TPA: hypothetical protein VKA14_06600 [Gammaproteobacteria bacterium]|nr:hypothetical protein [Gammaproteobacteria bacterium]